MEYKDLLERSDTKTVIQYFSERADSSLTDVKVAIAKVAELLSKPEMIEERLRMAAMLCRYMEPSREAVVAMLLHVVVTRRNYTHIQLGEWFSEESAMRYHNYMTEIRKVGSSFAADGEENTGSIRAVDLCITRKVCQDMFGALKNALKNRDTRILFDTYNYVFKRFGKRFSAQGLPLILHNIRIARILAEHKLDMSVISSGLLLGLYGESEGEEAKLEIAAVKECAYAAFEVDRLLRYASGYDHDVSYIAQKAEKSPAYRYGACIVAAERLYYLKNPGLLDEQAQKRLESEVNDCLLPLLSKLSLNDFCRSIDNCLRNVNEAEKYGRIARAFARVKRSAEPHTRRLFEDLHTMASNSYDDDVSVEVETYEYLPSEVYDRVSLLVPHEVSECDVNSNTVEICEFDVGLSTGCDINDFLKRFFSGLVASVASGDRGLTNISIDAYGRDILLIEEGGFRYKVCLAYCYDHAKARRGYEGSYKELSDESEPEIEPPQEKQIKIFLKDGAVTYLPVCSTPIDVGFRIHRDMGYAVCGALVNGKEKPITTRLREGDHVIVKTTDKAKDGSRPTTAKIAWLYYVKSDEARKCLIRFFSLRYEGLHSENVIATNEEADRVFDATMRALKAI